MQKKTKIIATIGPVSSDYDSLKKLAKAGVNIFRLNFSHGTHEWHEEVIKRIRRLNQKSKENYAILLDTKGPEIRTGDLKFPVELKKGDEVILSVDPAAEFEGDSRIGVNYDAFIQDVDEGEKILIDNGVMNFRVKTKTKTDVICEVLDGGKLTSRRHLNLPGKDVSLESITEKDWKDIKFGVKWGVDFIALSFVRRADEIYELKAFLKENNSKIDVIAKVESFEATKHLGTICEASDGIMVARGDLGAEIPFSHVPRVQREIVEICKNFQKPVIVATHMLESMIVNPIPTRAEVSDVSTAVFQRADAIMLSGETAGGKFPIKSAETMTEIALETEKEFLETRPIRKIEITSEREDFSFIAAKMAEDLPVVSAILVITRSGFMANLVSSFRPKVPIFAFTNESKTRRKMQLLWGVYPLGIEFSSQPQKTVLRAKEQFLKHYPEWTGKKFILISDFLVEGEFIPTLQIRKF
ncbi:pyruvate kinase [Candidatus Gracilibacteria bacterium]|nr:pyruvate kinase [Candidatus Gracilibacteria bacterium]